MIQIRNVLPQSVLAKNQERIPPRLVSHARVNIGQVAASAVSFELGTVLGSCVAVCLYDPIRHLGGMNHILLPGKSLNRPCTRYGIHAMEMLINDIMQLGGDRRRLVAKAFGGANVVQALKQTPVGDNNVKFVREFLATERIPLVAQRLGGSNAVIVQFRTDTGKAKVGNVDGSRLQQILRDEISYTRAHSADIYYTGAITLF
jgi:chemotaxis receptor (MCP) glutamine deamidase CheD